MSFLWIKYWNKLTFIMTDRNMETYRQSTQAHINLIKLNLNLI